MTNLELQNFLDTELDRETRTKLIGICFWETQRHKERTSAAMDILFNNKTTSNIALRQYLQNYWTTTRLNNFVNEFRLGRI